MTQLFSNFYLRVLRWSEARYAVYYLAMVSFLESSILPYPPPDILLMPMIIKSPKRAYRLAMITTIASVLGGILGYFLGETLLGFLQSANLITPESLLSAEHWFAQYGIWAVAVAAFTPIPYKIITILSGISLMSLLPFILVSIIARGARFYLLAFLLRRYSDQCDNWLRRYIDRLGYLMIVVVALGFWYAN